MDGRLARPLLALFVTTCVLGGPNGARAESPYVFGIHFWNGGANIDVMGHRTGWITEANAGADYPNIDVADYEDMVGEGFTIIQRLDWSSSHTVPITPGEQAVFASQCGSWAGRIGQYCRHYLIGNEMEISGVPDVEDYVDAFVLVREAIQDVQPDAKVIIGHFTNANNLLAAMQSLGPDGYDGICDHTGSTISSEKLDWLEQEGARPGVGMYISEWGWVVGTNENAQAAMENLREDINWSNANRPDGRQIYAATWFVYRAGIGWDNFSLQWAGWQDPNDYPENLAFEVTNANANAAVNAYANNPVIMSDLYADIWETGTSITVRWHTNVAARRQLWWAPSGAIAGQSSALNTLLSTTHEHSFGTSPGQLYEVMPISTRDDYGDAGGRRFRAKAGPWSREVTQTGAGRVVVHWNTDWPADSRVEYGPTSDLGFAVQQDPLVTDHHVRITGLAPGAYYYRILSSEPNPDPNGARLYMRSPAEPTFTVMPMVPGDFNDDDDVDMEDFGCFQACLSGPGIPYPAGCALADLNSDDYVDEFDFGILQGCFSGPNVPGNLDCAD